MAISDGGSIGTYGNTNTNQTGASFVTSADLLAGSFAILMVAIDNQITSDGNTDNPVASISDANSGSWARAGQNTIASGSAGNGVTVDVWLRQPHASQLNSASTITLSYNNAPSRNASAIRGWQFSASSTNILLASLTSNTGVISAGTFSTFTTLNPTTPTSVEHLRLRVNAGEASYTTALTPTSSWTAISPSVRSGGGASPGEVCVNGEFIISTGTNASSAPGFSSSNVDWALIYLAFYEDAVGHPARKRMGGVPYSVAATRGKKMWRESLSGLLVPDRRLVRGFSF